MERTVNIETITPAIAEELLSYNRRNRTLRRKRTNAIARDIVAGRWEFDGNPIRLNGDGTLLDGQHRLAAIVEAGIAVESVVVRGVASSAQAVMDSGAARTVADHLHIQGVENSSLLASMAKVAVNYERGLLTPRGFGGSQEQVTHQEINAWITEHHSEARSAMVHAHRQAKDTDCTPTVVAFSTWRLAQIDAEQAYMFWVDAAERVGLIDGDPVSTMARRFAEARRQRERLSSAAYLSAVFRTWNARREGRVLAKLPMHDTRNGRLSIPEPK